MPALLVFACTTLALAATLWTAADARPDVARRAVAGGQALSKAGFQHVRFRPDENGNLQLSGMVGSADEHRRLREWLARSPYADARASVQQSDRLIEQLGQVLAGESLQVTSEGARVRIEGEASRVAVKNQIRALKDELAGIVEIDDRVTVAAKADPGPGPLRVRVRNVMVGPPSYFRTDTGALYFEGAVMPDGAEVIGIEEKQIRFRLADKIIVYPLG